jgi:predicted DNA-binding transcriptional regulator YafY
MTRSTRMFEIIQLLRRAKGPVTAHAIAEALEVTKRTIYRDIAVLQARRVPIEGEAGVGYIMRAGFDLPPLMFDVEEMEAIFVGLALLGRTWDDGLARAAESAVAKITQVLPSEALQGAPLHVSTWTQIPESRIDPSDLRRHVREAEQLKITYLDLKEQRTHRTLLPLARVYYIDVIVLAAWCELRHDLRNFRVDRIETCRPTGESFADQSESLRDAWQRRTSNQGMVE